MSEPGKQMKSLPDGVPDSSPRHIDGSREPTALEIAQSVFLAVLAGLIALGTTCWGTVYLLSALIDLIDGPGAGVTDNTILILVSGLIVATGPCLFFAGYVILWAYRRLIKFWISD